MNEPYKRPNNSDLHFMVLGNNTGPKWQWSTQQASSMFQMHGTSFGSSNCTVSDKQNFFRFVKSLVCIYQKEENLGTHSVILTFKKNRLGIPV